MNTLIELGHYYLSEQIGEDVLFSIVYGLKHSKKTDGSKKMLFIDDVHGEPIQESPYNVAILTDIIKPDIIMYESETINQAKSVFSFLGENKHIKGNRILTNDGRYTCVAMDVALCFIKSSLGYKQQVIVLETRFEGQQRVLHDILNELWEIDSSKIDFEVRTIITHKGQIQNEYIF